jgi:hypothetical protein
METAQIVTGLWDHGWLCHDSLELRPAASDLALIEQYVASPPFYSFFIQCNGDETGMHGPFMAGSIHADDFIALQRVDLEHYLESIEFSEKPGEDVVERAKILPHLRTAFDGSRKCYILRRDERDKELFHDAGWVLWIFREFLFADSQRGSLERFIIGYD